MNLQDLMTRLGEPAPEQWLGRASERLPLPVSLLLIAGIAWYLSRLLWAVYPPPAKIDWQPPPASPAARTGTETADAHQDYRPLLSAHLFGKAVEGDAPAPAEVVDAPDTRLNLSLRATVAADDSRYAHAIIADGSGNEHAYFLNDEVPGGAKLHQVLPDRVILNRGGVLEALRLPKDFPGGGAAAPPSLPRATARRNSTPGVQQVLRNNASRLTDIIRPQPFMPNGQLKGYRLYPGRNRRQFAALGLRPGDLVTEINGMALNNPAQGMEVFRSLSDATQVTLTLERNGETQTINLDTSQLSAGNGVR